MPYILMSDITWWPWILGLKSGRVKFSYGSATSSCVTIGKSLPLYEPQCPFCKME